MRHAERWGRVAPNMEAGGSHPQATSDPGEEKEESNQNEVREENVEKDEEETHSKNETAGRL